MSEFFKYLLSIFIKPVDMLSSKVAFVVIILFFIILLNNLLGFVYYYNNDKKINEITSLQNIIKTNTDTAFTEKAKDKMNEILNHKNWFDNIHHFFLKNSDINPTIANRIPTSQIPATTSVKELSIFKKIILSISCSFFYILLYLISFIFISDKRPASAVQKIAYFILFTSIFLILFYINNGLFWWLYHILNYNFFDSLLFALFVVQLGTFLFIVLGGLLIEYLLYYLKKIFK